MRNKKSIITLLFCIALLFRLPLFHTEFIRTEDSTEYINIATNLATGKGYISTLQPYLTTTHVILPGNILRPMITPLVYAFFLRIHNDYYILQLFNLLLSTFVVVLFFLLAETFLPMSLAFLASLLIATNPYLIIESRFIISEDFFYCWVVLFFLFLFRLPEKAYKYYVLGLLIGLAYLTRVEGILLLLPLLYKTFRRPRWVLFGFITLFITTLPHFVLNYLATGNPLYSFYSYHLQVLSYRDAQEYFYHTLPSPLSFITHNFSAITDEIIGIIYGSIQTLLGLKFLGLMTLLLIVGLYKNKKATMQLAPILVFCFFMFVAETFSWAVAYQPERHLAIVFILLAFVTFVLAQRVISKKILYTVIVLTTLIYSAYSIHDLLWIRANSSFFTKKNDAALAWIRKNTNTTDVISTYDPGIVNLFTNRPSVILPDRFPVETHSINQLNQYIYTYHVHYIYTTSADTKLYDYLLKNGFKTNYDKKPEALFCVSKC